MLCTDEPWTACDVCLLWLALCICHVIYTQHYNVTELDSWTICKSFATASEKWAIRVYGTMGVYIYIYCLFKAYLGQLLDLPGALGPHLKGTEKLLAKKLINSYSKVVSMAASFGLVVVIVILSTSILQGSAFQVWWDLYFSLYYIFTAMSVSLWMTEFWKSVSIWQKLKTKI